MYMNAIHGFRSKNMYVSIVLTGTIIHSGVVVIILVNNRTCIWSMRSEMAESGRTSLGHS